MSSLAPPPTVPKRLIDALTFALLVLLGWQLAGWTWHFLAPVPAAAPAAAPASIGTSPEAARRLFGEAPPATSAPSSNAGIRLKGVYAIDGKTLSAAVVNTGGKRDMAVRVGEEIQPGTRLASVHPDHIIISRAAMPERIDLEKRIAMASAPSNAASATTGFRLNVATKGGNAYSLSRTELNNVLQDPRQMNYLGRIGMHPNGGVRLEQAPGGSLPGKLGLKEGDVIKNVNGQPVNSPGDLARLYQQFATLSQIRAEVVRGGVPMLLTYQIQQ
jgi:type II secretion system protein C